MHLPLVPDETLAWLLETYPQHRPDEEEAFNRWRQLHEYSYYMAEDPADPESGHGAAHARAVAPDQPAILVPASTVFGDRPGGLRRRGRPRPQDLRREGLASDPAARGLPRERAERPPHARARRPARPCRRGRRRRPASTAGEGEDPGEAPADVTFQGLLDGELKDFLPKEGEAPWMRYFRTAEPLTRADIETLPNLGDINLTLALQGLKTRRRLRRHADHPERQPHEGAAAPRRGPPASRPAPGRGAGRRSSTDSSSPSASTWRRRTLGVPPRRGRAREARTAGGPSDGEAPPESPEPEAVWTRTLETWMAAQDARSSTRTPASFVGAKPPRPRRSTRRRTRPRRPGSSGATSCAPPATTRCAQASRPTSGSRPAPSRPPSCGTTWRTGATACSSSASRASPSAARRLLAARLRRLPLRRDPRWPQGRATTRRGRGAGQVDGSLWEGLRHFYFDFAWLKSKFDLVTEVDPEAQMQE